MEVNTNKLILKNEDVVLEFSELNEDEKLVLDYFYEHSNLFFLDKENAIKIVNHLKDQFKL